MVLRDPRRRAGDCYAKERSGHKERLQMTRLEEYNERRKLDAGRKTRNRRKTNRAAFQRLDRTRCAICPATHNIEAHHIIPRSKFAKGEPCDVDENLLAVCHGCHQDHHTTAHKRIPRLVLSEAQIAFVLARQGEAWIDRWYPA